MTKPRLATMWLDGCSGCHMSLLDLDEALITISQRVDLVYSPLVDAREYPHDVDVALVEGAVSTEEDLEKIRQVRERTRILVALGDCATTSNISGARNPIPLKDLFERIYVEGADVDKGIPADPALPILLKHAVPLHDVVKIDLHVPGCPPSAPTILFVLNELLDGRIPDLRARTRFG
ncbi:MAG: oxidoreductase [Acetobacteraceae bacterium]|jgi:NAD-reducing hydrogenase small subunit